MVPSAHVAAAAQPSSSTLVPLMGGLHPALICTICSGVAALGHTMQDFATVHAVWLGPRESWYGHRRILPSRILSPTLGLHVCLCNTLWGKQGHPGWNFGSVEVDINSSRVGCETRCSPFWRAQGGCGRWHQQETRCLAQPVLQQKKRLKATMHFRWAIGN